MRVSEGALEAPSDGRTAGGEGGIPVERSRRREPESLSEGGRSHTTSIPKPKVYFGTVPTVCYQTHSRDK